MSIRVSLRCSRVDLVPFESILPAGHGGASYGVLGSHLAMLELI
jgi:hypothetical protein